jgi:hypothetical protein
MAKAQEIDLSDFDEELKKAPAPDAGAAIDLSDFDAQEIPGAVAAPVAELSPAQKLKQTGYNFDDFQKLSPDQQKEYFELNKKDQETSLTAVGRGLPQAFTGTYGDEASAALESGVIAPIANKLGLGPDVSYDVSRAQLRQQNAQAEKDSPNMYAATQFAVGAALPVGKLNAALKAAGMASNYARAALLGGGLSGAVGLGSSEADLTSGKIEDYKDAAGDVALNAGFGALLGLGGQAVTSGDALKAGQYVYGKSKDVGKKVLASAQNISPDSINDYLTRRADLKRIRKLGENSNQAVVNYVQEEIVPEVAAKKSNFIKKQSDLIDNAVEQESTADVQGRTAPLFDAFDEQLDNLAPGGIATTPEQQAAYNQVFRAREQLARKVESIAGADAEDIASLSGYAKTTIPAPQLNEIVKSLQRSSQGAYSAKSNDVPEVAGALSKVATAARRELGDIIPGIQQPKQNLQAGFDASEKLNRFGLNEQFGVDENKLVSLFRAGPSTSNLYSKNVSTLDDLYGTQLGDQTRMARSVQDMFPDDSITNFKTGRSSFLGNLTGSVGKVFGAGDKAQAVGDVLSSNFATKPLLIAGDYTDRAVNRFASPVVQRIQSLVSQVPPELQKRIGSGILASQISPFISTLPPEAYDQIIKQLYDAEMPATQKSKLINEMNRAR